MKKKAICIVGACFALLTMLLLGGCGSRIDYSLPANPIEFNTGTFINPNNPDDEYISIEYNGRTYITYGTINGIVPKDDLGYDFWKNVPSDNPTDVSEQSDSTEKTDSQSVGGPYGEI